MDFKSTDTSHQQLGVFFSSKLKAQLFSFSMDQVKILLYFKATNLIMRFFIYLITTLLFTASCKNNESDPLVDQVAAFKQLQEQTLDIHNEAMQLGVLMDLSMAVEERKKTEYLSDEMIRKLDAAQIELGNAHDAMMDWMKEYSTNFPFEAEPPTSKEALDEKMPILESSFEQIKHIQEQTDKVIKYTEQLLNKTA